MSLPGKNLTPTLLKKWTGHYASHYWGVGVRTLHHLLKVHDSILSCALRQVKPTSARHSQNAKGVRLSRLVYRFILGPLFWECPYHPLGGLYPIQKIHRKLTGAPTRCQNFQLPQFLHILMSKWKEYNIYIYIHTPKIHMYMLYPYTHMHTHIPIVYV